MIENTDRERAIFFEGRMREAQANLTWLREQLAEAHRIIGVLIQNTTKGAGIVTSIQLSFPNLHPQSKTPGEKALAEWEKLLGHSSRLPTSKED